MSEFLLKADQAVKEMPRQEELLRFDFLHWTFLRHELVALHALDKLCSAVLHLSSHLFHCLVCLQKELRHDRQKRLLQFLWRAFNYFVHSSPYFCPLPPQGSTDT